MEHTAELRGIRYSRSLQQEASDYYRMLTPALEMLVRGPGVGGVVGGRGLQKLDAELLLDLVIPRLRVSPRDTETHRNGPRCARGGGVVHNPPREEAPQIDVHRWMNGHTCVCPHREWHSATKRRKALIRATVWMDLENVMLCELFVLKFKRDLIQT